MANTAPTPDLASSTRFLLTCPMLRHSSAAQVEPLAKHLRLRRYDRSSYLLRDVVPDRDTPLRVLTHGQASWESSRSHHQKGAWMMTPGSVLGLDALNDWAYHAGYEGTWPREDLAKIRCKAASTVWVLELPPDRFDEAFDDPASEALLAALLRMVPTLAMAPEIVAAMTQSAQFSQLSPLVLHRLLEYAPTLRLGAPVADKDDAPQQLQEQQQAQQLLQEQVFQAKLQSEPHAPPAVYYVLDGELLVTMQEETISFQAGELGGPELFETGDVLARFHTRATRPTNAVALTRAALIEMMRSTPGFARKLGPRRHGKRVSQ